MKAAWGSVTDRALLALEEFGPMTRQEIEEAIGLEPRGCAGIIARLARELKPTADGKKKRRVHICRWASEGSNGYASRWVAVYKLGHGENKPKPPPRTKKENNARYWGKRRDRLQNASVFRIGSPSSFLMRKDCREAA